MMRWLLCFGLAFALFFDGDPAVAQAHACRGSVSAVQGQVAKGGTSLVFSLVGRPAVYTLGQVLVPGQPISLDGQRLLLFPASEGADRYGRRSVQAYTQSGEWVQGRLLAKGQAVVFADGAAKSCLLSLRAAERAAETRKAGLWSKKALHFAADDIVALKTQIARFVIVSGKVVSVGDRKRRLYLNFGEKWDQDFTVSVVKRGKGAFKGDASQLAGLRGQSVRVRGFLEDVQGPLIRLFDEGQLERRAR